MTKCVKCGMFSCDGSCGPENPKTDPVNKPSHYSVGKIQPIDFIADQKLNFNRGNAVKYIVRAGRKDPAKELEDLKKAKFYLEHEINEISRRKD